MPQRTTNKVKVYVRTRPTNNFATDMLAIGRDSRVCTFLLLLREKGKRILDLSSRLVFIEHLLPVLWITKSMIGHFISMEFFIMLIKRKSSIRLEKMLSIEP